MFIRDVDLVTMIATVDTSSAETVSVGEIALSRLSLQSAVARFERRLERSAGGYVCFVNVHTFTEAARNSAFADALRGATHCFADGVPLLWLASAKGKPLAGRVCGPDFMDAMLRARTRRHGFIGGLPGCGERIARRYSVEGVTYSPPMRPFAESSAREDWHHFLDRCREAPPPRIVWVGLGAPKQELWISFVSKLAPEVLFLGVGAAFDFLSLAKPRAPAVMQRYGVEWLHRLAAEPRRLLPRYVISNTRFALLCVRELVR